ncbi:MAG: N-acetyltransferase [Desulfobulbaceae bacterium]|nr:N-acetyltransferase [Desulfobulbaceae bacterium]
MVIRNEKPGDIDKIWHINVEAFGTAVEADLVNTLRDSGSPYISLVYEQNSQPVGHIMFTPVELTGDTSGLRLMGLAPMSVIPRYQNSGIGSSLVDTGIELCKAEGYDAIVVLGRPEFYSRFGFVPSVRYGIKSEYDVPPAVFMILELKENGLIGKHGTIKFHDSFAGIEQ